MHRDDISDRHRSRLAYVYIRQSSLHQVRENLESRLRQLSLKDRAVELGWDPCQVVEVDEDLGVSASRNSRNRIGFDDMVAHAALGKIGLVICVEASRLSRSNRDWYHLLDICAITSTLIADADGVYDPRNFNDRLLLGLKATMSEAELHTLRQRLVEAVRQKAQRGELRIRLPAGYVWDEAGRIVITPDEQVVTVIRLVFQRFDELGSVNQTHLSLVDDGMRFPVPARSHGQVQWKLPSYGNIHSMLTNPTYAGVYVYGRTQTEETLDESHNPIKRRRRVEDDQLHAYIEGHHDGYILLEVFERNQKQIADNRRSPDVPGPPREGKSLLHGLVLCGRCGRRMKVAYGKDSRPTVFRCVRSRQELASPVCQSFGARRLEQAVEKLVLQALEPVGLEAMARATEAQAEAAEAEHRHWQQQIERAEYEAEVARRQYNAADPENRLVARELERRFEDALQAVEAARREEEGRLRGTPVPFAPEERERLLELADDLPRLWRAPTTRPQDRSRICRCLIDQVVVSAPDDVHLRADVHWCGGEISTVEVRRGKPGVHRHAAESELIEQLRELSGEFSDAQIARIMHRRRLRTPKGLTFTAHRVACLRNRHGIPCGPRVPVRGDDIYTAERAAEALGVALSTVIRWVEAGLLKGSQSGPGAPWRIQVTPDDVRRLTAADAPEGWMTLRAAAEALGVSQQTVLQKLKSGEMKGVRVRAGRRTAWRIQVDATRPEDQVALFE